MPGEIWVGPDQVYRRIEMTEADYEKLVARYQAEIFGDRTLLLIKRPFKSPLGDVVPDGVLVALKEPVGWFLVEIETAQHNVSGHILPQVTKMCNVALRPEDAADLVAKVSEALGRSGGEVPPNPATLLNLFKSRPGVVLVIDHAGEDVRTVINALRSIHLMVAVPYYGRDGRYALQVSGALPATSGRILLEVPAGSGVFGAALLRIVAGSQYLPEGGEIFLKRGEEQVSCKILDTGSSTMISAKLSDIERMLGSVAGGCRILLAPLMPFQVYACERDIE